MRIQFKASIPLSELSGSNSLSAILQGQPPSAAQTLRINFTITHVLKDDMVPIRLAEVVSLRESFIMHVPLDSLLQQRAEFNKQVISSTTSTNFKNKILYLYLTNPITKKNKFALLLPILQENYYQLAIVPNNEKFKKLCYNTSLINLQNFMNLNLTSQQNEVFLTGLKDYNDFIEKVSIPDTITPIPLSSQINFSMSRPLPSIPSNLNGTTDEIIKDIDPLEFLKDRYSSTLYNNTIQFQVFSKTALPRLYLLSRANQKLVLTTLVEFLIFNISQFDSFYKNETLTGDFNETMSVINRSDIKEYLAKNNIELELDKLENNEKFDDLIQDLKAREARLQVLICLETLSILIANPDLQDTDTSSGNVFDISSLSQPDILVKPVVKRQLIGRKKKRLTPTLIGDAIPADLTFTTDLRGEEPFNNNIKPKETAKEVVKPLITIPSIRNILHLYFERICLYEAIKGTNIKDKDSSFNFILVSIIPYFQNRVNNRIIKELVNKARGPSLTAKKRHEKKKSKSSSSSVQNKDPLSSSHTFSQSQSSNGRSRLKRSDSIGSLSPISSFQYNDIFSDTQLNNSQNSLRSQNDSSGILDKEILLSKGKTAHKVHMSHSYVNNNSHQAISLKRTTSNLDKKSFDMISNASFTSLASQVISAPVADPELEERSFFKRREKKRILKPSAGVLSSQKEKTYITQIEATPMKKKSTLIIEESPVIYNKSMVETHEKEDYDLIKVPRGSEHRNYRKRNMNAHGIGGGEDEEVLIDSSPFGKPGVEAIANDRDHSLLLSPLNLRHPAHGATSAITSASDLQRQQLNSNSSKYVDNLVLSSPIASKKIFESPSISATAQRKRKAELEIIKSSPVDHQHTAPTFMGLDKLTTPIFKKTKRSSLSGSNTKPGEFILPQSSPFYEHNRNGNHDQKDNGKTHSSEKINRKLQFD